MKLNYSLIIDIKDDDVDRVDFTTELARYIDRAYYLDSLDFIGERRDEHEEAK